jgi:Fe-S cluster assembly protein SufD
MTTTQTTDTDVPGVAAVPRNGLAEHSHVGGRTVRAPGAESHLHPTGSTDVADHAVPTSKSEPWRFTPLRRLRDLHADAPFAAAGSLSCRWEAPEGVTVRGTTGDEARALKGASGYLPTDRFTARIMAEVPDSLLVDVPADAEVTEPVLVTLEGTDAGITEAGHILIRIGERANATVVLTEEGSATVAHLVEIAVGDGARLNLVTVADWASDTVQLTHHNIAVGRDATVKHTALTFGGNVVRTSVEVDYQGPGGDVELLGLYFADEGQHLEHRMFVDHDAPHCRSRVLYKGALQGHAARTVWIGDVLIQQSAEGTDTYEMNRNLLLTDGCRADSVPNLEIETGEIVGAGHASATGRLDDEHLFYLQSRGITPEMAKRLVVRGFFGEVLHKVGVPAVVDRITGTIEKELAISGN